MLYQNALSIVEPDRTLYLAIREAVYADIFEEEIGKMLIERNVLKLIAFNAGQEIITRWIR